MSSYFNQRPFLIGVVSNTSRLFATLSTKSSQLLTILFISLSAWLSGQIFWLLYQSSNAETPWAARVTKTNVSKADVALYDTSDLIEARLFGHYSEKSVEAPVAPVVQDAPKTRLNLILVGAVSSSKPEYSLAVISNKGVQVTYGIGEKIEGTQAKLRSVFIDRVIIDNSGRDETLMLEGIDDKSTPRPEVRQSRNGAVSELGNNPNSAEEQLDAIRSEVLQEPQKILQYIRLSQVKRDGNLVGYQVRPGKNKLLFDSVGLKNGDIAISLNGEDLTDPAAMEKIWQSISELTEFTLVVEREGQTHEVYMSF